MGSHTSKDQVASVTNSLYNVINTTTQNCGSSQTQSQVINISNNKNAGFTAGNINLAQNAQGNFSCYNDSTAQTTLTNNLTQTAQQQATATTQIFQIPTGSTQATTIAQYTTNLATTINNAFLNTCLSQVNQAQGLNFTNNKGKAASANVGNLTFSQSFDEVVNCLQNNANVISAQTNLQQAIGQQAVSSVSSTWIIAIVIAVIAVIVVIGIIIAVIVFTIGRTAKTGLETYGEVSHGAQELLTNPQLAQNALAVGSLVSKVTPIGAAAGAAGVL